MPVTLDEGETRMNRTSSIAILLSLALAACGRATLPTAIAPLTYTPAPTHASSPTGTPDVCAGATDPGARQKFAFEQIVPCLNTVPKVSAFVANNVKYDVEYDTRERGGNEYAPAQVVYERGVDDADGLAILACYFLERNGMDASMIGLSIEAPVGSNVCGANTNGAILVLAGAGQVTDPFNSLADVAQYFIGKNWMKSGGTLRTIKASQVTRITTDKTTPSVLDLPWVLHPY
jgi:hypothetical protein